MAGAVGGTGCEPGSGGGGAGEEVRDWVGDLGWNSGSSEGDGGDGSVIGW